MIVYRLVLHEIKDKFRMIYVTLGRRSPGDG